MRDPMDGLLGLPFPLTVSLTPVENGVECLHVTPLQLCAVVDLFVASHPDCTWIVHDVDHYCYEGGRGAMLPLARVAEERAIRCEHSDGEVVAVAGPELIRLFTGFDHFNATLFAARRVQSLEDMTRLYVRSSDAAAARDAHPLVSLPDAPCWAHSNDDCYTDVESRSHDLSLRVASRMLALRADAHGRAHQLPEVEPPDPALVEALIAPGAAFTTFHEWATVEHDIITLPFSREPWTLGGRRDLPEAGRLTYDARTRAWRAS